MVPELGLQAVGGEHYGLGGRGEEEEEEGEEEGEEEKEGEEEEEVFLTWKYLTLGYCFFRNPSNSSAGSSGCRNTASTSTS